MLTDSIPPYTTIKEPDYVIGGGIFQTLHLLEKNYLRIAVMGSKKTTPTQTNPKGTTQNTDIRTYNATITDEHTFGKLALEGGIKFMQNYYKKYAPGSASIYITNQWQPMTTSFNLGTSYKFSSLLTANLLVNDGVVKAPLNTIDRNIAGKDTSYVVLKDENRLNIDLGVVSSIKNLGDIALTAFFINRKNAYEYTGNLYYDNLGIQREYLNNLDLRSYGIELGWKSPLYFGILSSNINATYMKTLNVTSGANTVYENLPQTIINGSLNAGKYGFTLGVFGKYVSKYTASTFITPATPTTKVYIGDYTNFDLSLGYAIPNTPISVYGRVINIGDVKFCTVSPVFPDYGRQFFVGARAKF